jgi:lysozyme
VNQNLQYTGQALTEQFEGCSLTAYQDSGGVWTIGFGHTAGVTEGMTCTQAQAEAWLLEDIQWAVSTVQNRVLVPLTQGEFDALVDFVFNVGSGNFASSTMLRMLNAGNFAGAADQFARWDLAGGQVVAGLLRRRIAEEGEFNE